MDVICAQCAEPWEYYGIEHGDFEEEDIEPFFWGDFCPSCRNHPKRRKKDAKGLGRFFEQHIATLLKATDGPVRSFPYLPF